MKRLCPSGSHRRHDHASPVLENHLLVAPDFLLFTLLAFPQSARASSLVVNTFDDVDDGMCDVSHCSLREAILAAQRQSGGRTLSTFDVPDGGSNIIRVSSPLPALAGGGTTIDATTLPYYAGYPEVFLGKDVDVIATGLLLASNDNVIRGLGFAGFGLWPSEPSELVGAIVITGSGNLIEENAIGLGASWNSTGVRLGGPGNSVRNNTISGNETGISADSPNQVIQGNIIGVAADGATPVHNDVGIRLYAGADHTLIGGAGVGEGNLISASQTMGIACYSEHNEFYGNLIGTDITGSYSIMNGYGMYVAGANTRIGGGTPGQGNVISGNGSSGLWIIYSHGHVIQGNHIGTDITGTIMIPNATYGVELWSSSNTIIGGVSPELGNVIMGNESDGIFIYGAHETFIANNIIAENGDAGIQQYMLSDENTFTQNSIYGNDGLGIEITGGNSGNSEIQPPILSGGPGTTISGSACPNCLIEFFIADPDPTGFGEGKTYLGLGYADSNGDFSVPVDGIGFCQQITATATDTTDWNTSEFSQNVYANCIQLQPRYLVPSWVFTIFVFGVLAWIVRRRRPDSRRAVLIGAAAGGLLFLILIFALPFIRPEFKALPECGNGVIESGETCDGDDLTQCLSGQICKNCRCTTVVEMPVCGDGVVDEGEQCDGDDLTLCLSGQICENCRCTTIMESSFCGDGDVDEGEQCDGDDLTQCLSGQVCENCRCVTLMEAEPPSEGCFYTALSNTNCRQSDYRESDPVAIVMEGESALLVGLNPDYTHGLFELESGSAMLDVVQHAGGARESPRHMRRAAGQST